VRVTHVVARAFGPFHGERLDLAPGMSVITGPNESGKSSWHAALRMALTGLRRGRGRSTAADAALAALHRPWDAQDAWEVEAGLVLDDGRSIELRQDLDGKVACSALDIGLGRDVSSEILDGTPDASRWLGLDRDAFSATVSVSQAQIMAVTEAADDLQEQMQRAAATRGTDATAAEAIDRLAAFRRDAVGAESANAKGPLRAARVRLSAAQERLTAAQAAHAEHLAERGRSEDSSRRVAEARLDLDLALVAQARQQADHSARLAARAAELSARHPNPPAMLSRDRGADLVAAAIASWERRPSIPELAGPSHEALEAQLKALPPRPDGDVAPHPAVIRAVQDLGLAEEAIQLLGEAPNVDDAASPHDEVRLRELARRIRAGTPSATRGPSAGREGPHASGRLSAMARALAVPSLLVGVGLLLASLGQPLAALACVGIAMLVATWAAGRLLGPPEASTDPALESFRRAAQRTLVDAEGARRAAASDNLPTDPDALDALADRALLAARDRDLVVAWESRRREAAARLAEARDRLLLALTERGAEVSDDARASWLAYRAACEQHAAQAAAAARAETLAAQLAGRRAVEESVIASTRAVEAARSALAEAAEAVGVQQEGSGPDEICERLRHWQREQASTLEANRIAIEEWRELETILGGATIADLAEEATRRASAAARLGAELPRDAGNIQVGPDLEGLIDERRRSLAAAESEAAERRGALESSVRVLPDVAEAEEAVATAKEQLARVESTARIVDETLRLLRMAQERVHRDLAPILADAVRRWLPSVSGGAYQDASVDPADLSIQVKETRTGIWREARLLSEGTREQIYLLLRVAMAQHLVTTDETAPLLLDEVTAQADGARRAALLGVLHELSAERQVVLFTHDAEVAAWAERSLAGPRDKLIRLPSLTVGGSTSRGAARIGTPVGEPIDVEPEAATVAG
jgi:AAA domain